MQYARERNIVVKSARRAWRRGAARREAMPGSVLTVQLGQCGNQVRRACHQLESNKLCPVPRSRCPPKHLSLIQIPSVASVQVGTELFCTLANEADAAPPAVRAEIHQVRAVLPRTPLHPTRLHTLPFYSSHFVACCRGGVENLQNQSHHAQQILTPSHRPPPHRRRRRLSSARAMTPRADGARTPQHPPPPPTRTRHRLIARAPF